MTATVVTIIVSLILAAASVALSELLRTKPAASLGDFRFDHRTEEVKNGLFTSMRVHVPIVSALPPTIDCEWCGRLLRTDVERCQSCGAPRRGRRFGFDRGEMAHDR